MTRLENLLWNLVAVAALLLTIGGVWTVWQARPPNETAFQAAVITRDGVEAYNMADAHPHNRVIAVLHCGTPIHVDPRGAGFTKRRAEIWWDGPVGEGRHGYIYRNPYSTRALPC